MAARTQVFFSSGKRRQALAVAKDLKVPTSDVAAVTSDVSAKTVSPQSPTPPAVIVQIGANQANP